MSRFSHKNFISAQGSIGERLHVAALPAAASLLLLLVLLASKGAG